MFNPPYRSIICITTPSIPYEFVAYSRTIEKKTYDKISFHNMLFGEVFLQFHTLQVQKYKVANLFPTLYALVIIHILIIADFIYFYFIIVVTHLALILNAIAHLTRIFTFQFLPLITLIFCA